MISEERELVFQAAEKLLGAYRVSLDRARNGSPLREATTLLQEDLKKGGSGYSKEFGATYDALSDDEATAAATILSNITEDIWERGNQDMSSWNRAEKECWRRHSGVLGETRATRLYKVAGLWSLLKR